MELLIGLAVIIAVSELKEWRASKRHAEADDRMQDLDDSISTVLGNQELTRQWMNDQREAVDLLSKRVAELNERLGGMNDFVLKAQGDLATIVQEYDLNGIPLGYKRRDTDHADFIEGV